MPYCVKCGVLIPQKKDSFLCDDCEYSIVAEYIEKYPLVTLSFVIESLEARLTSLEADVKKALEEREKK
jgi:hypothetical protein